MSLREKIIRESLRLFSLKGFLNTSLSDILRAAGTSKGGFYNHFKSKDDLFLAVLSEARRVWRGKNLAGLDHLASPVGKVKKLLENYRDRYLKDKEMLPGGCIFVTLCVELDDQRPLLAQELTEGFLRLKAMLNRLLKQAQAAGELRAEVNTENLSEMILAGMLGASIYYGVEKNFVSLDRSLNSLIAYLDELSCSPVTI
jgi:TetR/AcrR family transcriptional repressor of nem operon